MTGLKIYRPDNGESDELPPKAPLSDEQRLQNAYWDARLRQFVHEHGTDALPEGALIKGIDPSASEEEQLRDLNLMIRARRKMMDLDPETGEPLSKG